MSLLLSNPPAIIFVNNDLSLQVKNVLIRQLHIDQVFDGYEFDQIIETDPNWANNIKNIYNQRILVIRSFRELQNREYADVVAFIAHGLITIEQNKFGPPISAYPVSNIHWGQLCIFIKKKGPGNISTTCCGCGVDVACTMRQELDNLNRRICSSCCSCNSCCACPQPTFKTLLVPMLPRHSTVKGV